jgi:Flp pilus assembly protein TadD
MKMHEIASTPINRWQVSGLIIGLAVLGVATGGDADDQAAWQVRLERGRERAKRREWEAAAAELTEAIRLAPRESAPWIERGNARGELGRFSEARADFARATEVDPGNPEPRYRLALAFIAEGDDDGYRRACGDLLACFGASEASKVASPLAYTCVARPRAVDAPDALVRWASGRSPSSGAMSGSWAPRSIAPDASRTRSAGSTRPPA